MQKKNKIVISLIVKSIVLIWVSGALAQGSLKDYERAKNLRHLTQNKVFKIKIAPHWFDGNTRFWYRNDLATNQHQFIEIDAVKGTRRPLFNHVKLANALSRKAEKKLSASNLPIQWIDMNQSNNTMRFKAANKIWQCNLKNYQLEISDNDKAPAKPKQPPSRKRRSRNQRAHTKDTSPGGQWKIVIKDHNAILQNIETNKQTKLTTDGNEKYGYIARFYWSPDSKKLVVMRQQKGQERKVYIIESSPSDQVQPKLHHYNYDKPGDRITFVKPHLFDIATKKEINIDNTLFDNPFKIERIRWDADSGQFTFEFNQRGHQAYRIIAVNANTGQPRAIINEQSKTFFCYSSKKFVQYLNNTNEIIWMSERDGWNHLYLYDTKTGKVKNQITQGNWIVRGVDHVDVEKRQIWFHASGLYPNQDPYYLHYCRINFNGTGLVKLTQGDGTHEITYSPDRRFIIDRYSRVDMPTVTELRNAKSGKRIVTLERGDMTQLLKVGWKKPQRFVAKGRDGKTNIHGVIIRPTNFNPKKKYPVIENIYAGPHSAFAYKSFRSYYGDMALAELGFIVVKLDGMGTSHRSKAFHDICWKNLGDSGFPDRIAWIKATAKIEPAMDLSRVGIFGGSAGGQSSTRALLAHNDFYHVAVSDCGCHDNRMDKIWWNEQWMGYPVDESYKKSSNVEWANKLKGKLLLIVGELDRNVDPASTLQVVNALIKADKDFDFLLIPGAGHGAAGSKYGHRRQNDYFVRHLLNVEPRWQ